MNVANAAVLTPPAASPRRRMPSFRARPLAALGAWAVLLLRALMAVFFISAGYNKVSKAWMSTDILRHATDAARWYQIWLGRQPS